MSVKVSIIVPCYGVEKYLDRCMETLVNQTLKDIEIILVDDGSPDRIPEMCDEWAKKDCRIKVIHKQNGGLGFARNSGIEVATGAYIAFVDSDDYVRKDAYQLYYEAAINNEADVVFGGINTETQPGVWNQNYTPAHREVLDKEQTWEYAKDMVACLPHVKQEKKNSMSVWHSIYKASIIRDNNIRFLSEREIASEDLPFQLMYLRRANKTVLIPEALYYYCLNGGSLTTTFKKEKFNRFCQLRLVITDLLGKDQEAIQRSDRLFLGCARTYTTKLVRQENIKKMEDLREMLSNNVWHQLRSEYNPSYLPFLQGMLYRLQLVGSPRFLLLYTRLFLFFKQKTGKKVFVYNHIII